MSHVHPSEAVRALMDYALSVGLADPADRVFLTNALIACGIFFVLWAGYTVFLFRRRIFKKRYAGKPVEVWQEEKV